MINTIFKDILIITLLIVVFGATLVNCAGVPPTEHGGMAIIDHTIDRSLPQERVPCG